MLCFRYDLYRDRIKFPSAIQPKLDGVRLLYRKGVFQSRSARGSVIKTLQPGRLSHIRSALSWLDDDHLLDGEAYIHGVSRQRINGLVSVNSSGDLPESSTLEFHIFDCVNARTLDASFEDRWAELNSLWQSSPSLKLVPTHYILSPEEGDSLYSKYRGLGYEGIVYRQPSAPYGFAEACGNQENRWHYIHKRKSRVDAEFECVGTRLGTGKYDNSVGSLEFYSSFGKLFSAGSGLSDAQRQEFVTNPPIGRLVTLEYDILSEDGTPIQPTIKFIHDE